jgi:hypothetical protein
MLKDVCQNFQIENIFNTDELGLFYCLGPDKTLASRSDEAKGTKKNKNRVTILLTANATGTSKVKPWVINKHEMPRCLKNVKPAILPGIC